MNSERDLDLRRPDVSTIRPPELMGSYARESGRDMGAFEVWRVIRKRRRLIVGTFLCTALLVGGVSFLLPKKYDAVSRIALDFNTNDVLGIEQGAVQGTNADSSTKINTQIQILESDTLAFQVIKKLRLDQKKAFAGKNVSAAGADIDHISREFRAYLLGKFATSLEVQNVRETEILTIRFRSQDPELAAAVANALTKAYTEQNFQSKYTATIEAADWLSQKLEDVKKHAEEAQQNLAAFQQKARIIGTDETNNLEIEKLTELNKQMVLAEAERISKEAQYRMVQTRDPNMIASVTGAGLLSGLRTQEATLKAQRAQLAEKFGPNYPRLREINEEIADVDTSITAELGRISDQSRREFDASQHAEQLMRAKLTENEEEAFRKSEDFMQFAIMLKDVQSSRDLYEDLMKKLKEAGVLAGLRSTNATVVDPAAAPVFPSEPRLPLNIAIGMLAGIVLGFAAAITAENMDTTIRTADEIESIVGLPTFGIIPRIKRPSSRALAAISDPDLRRLPAVLSNPRSSISEAYRAMRSSLLLSSAGAPPKIIMITSASPAEGKTTTSLNCAMVLAQAGQRVLLVEGDMRRPSLLQQLGIVSGPGLSECLSGVTTPEQCVFSYPKVPGLSILSGGALPPYPSELLSSATMSRLLNRWREEYDHVVFDTPPVLAVTDAVVLAKVVDSVVVVARATRTMRQALRRTCGMLRAVNAKIAGVILNDVDPGSVEYMDYYGYYGNAYNSYYLPDAKAAGRR